MAEVTITLKAGTGFDAPWIVVRGDGIDDASKELEELRNRGGFEAVRTLAQEFQNAKPIKTAEQVVKDAFPGATEVAQPAAAPAAATVQQSTPPCETCGQPTKLRKGTHPKTGAWAGYFCASSDRDHTTWLEV